MSEIKHFDAGSDSAKVTPLMNVKAYEALGIDVGKAVETALKVPISIHCWQADDVAGLESGAAAADSGGIKSTGNYPGKARNGDEMRVDFEKVLSLVPGIHRVNIHAFYAEPGKNKVDRDGMELSHFQNWMDWGVQGRMGWEQSGQVSLASRGKISLR